MANTASQPRQADTQNKQDGDCACVAISDDNHDDAASSDDVPQPNVQVFIYLMSCKPLLL